MSDVGSGKLTQRKFSFLLRGGGRGTGTKPDNRHRPVDSVLGACQEIFVPPSVRLPTTLKRRDVTR